MAMNFWEVQARARKQTLLYLALFVLLTVVAAVLLEFALRYFAPDQYSPPYPIFGFSFLVITFGAAFVQYSLFSAYGGKYVAESMGARLVDHSTTDPKERLLARSCLNFPKIHCH